MFIWIALSSKTYQENNNKINDFVSEVRYTYDLNLNIYKEEIDKIVKVNPSTVFDNLGLSDTGDMSMASFNNMGEINSWTELSDNKELLKYYMAYNIDIVNFN